MKKFFLFLFFDVLCIAMLPLQAKKVDREKAEQVAQNYVQSKQKLRIKPGVRLKYTATGRQEQHENKLPSSLQDKQDSAYYYVFNIEKAAGGGFVIVAADDAVKPVLGYSDNGSYDENKLPPNFAYWLDCLQQQIAYAQTHNLPQSEEVRNEWKAYLNGEIVFSTETTTAPLIQTRWGQGQPYNDLCPFEDGHLTPVGCVATAMAQIMKYHQFPASGSGKSVPYTTNRGLHLPSTSFEVNYDWDNMLNTYSGSETSQQQKAVATLIYHCGISVLMQYSFYFGSGAHVDDLYFALKKYFGYGKNMQLMSRLNHDDREWKSVLKTQIDAGLPVFYVGGDHAFICDGYSEDDKFHFNWGWSGACDGYYAMGELYPGGNDNNFNNAQGIIINIKPEQGLLSDLNVSKGILSPVFRPFVFDYTVQVDASLESIDITGITDMPGVTVTGNVTGWPLKLNDFTDIAITVTDANGDSQTYTITVIRGSIEPVSFTWDIPHEGQEMNFQLGVKYGELCTIDWGDGSPKYTFTGGRYDVEIYFHTYNLPGTYQVTIQGEGNRDCPVVRLYQNEYGLDPDDYSITQIDLRAASELKAVGFGHTEIRDLDVSRNRQLSTLSWSNGKLFSLNVSNNKVLKNLRCINNAIPLINLYALVQQTNHHYYHFFDLLFGSQFLPDAAGLPNTYIAIDTVFHGVNSVIEVNTDAANYTLSNGKIIFLSEGIYTVKVSNPAILNGNVNQTFYVGNVVLNKRKTTVYLNTTEQLTAKSGIPGNEPVTWNSSNTAIATVNSEGLVRGITPGTAIITATTQDRNYSADCEITVTYDVSLKSLSISSKDFDDWWGFGLQLRPPFHADITEYTVNVPNKVASITIKGEANHVDAIVTGNVTDHPLNVGENPMMITVTAEDGKTARTYTVTVIRDDAVSIKDLFVPALNIYPNPFTREVRLTGAEGYKLQVITVTGAVVHTQNITNPDETLRLEYLPTGVYFFRIGKGIQVKTVKIIKNQ